MRPATVQERYEFYHQEFRTNLVRDWFRGWTTPIVFAVVIGRHTEIFPVEYRRERSRTILIDEYEGLRDLRQYCMEFRPESVFTTGTYTGTGTKRDVANTKSKN